MRLHCDPDRKLASLLLGRGADAAWRNVDGLAPAQGLALLPEACAAERTLLAQQDVEMPLKSVARTHARHHQVLRDARAQLARATPAPDPEAYRIVPKVLPPWEEEDAHVMSDRGMLARKEALAAARRAAREAAERKAEGPHW